ncbi:MAG: DUF305 domain-containing protein [Microterricola sp.]
MTDTIEHTTDAAEAVDASEGAEPARRIGGRVLVAIIAVLAIVVVALVSFSIGRLSTIGATPGDTSAEAGFARDMQAHHVQGVEMAMIIRDLTDDPETRLLAYDIATTQGQQSGQLYGWLSEWGLGQFGTEPSMTWMTRPALNGEGGHAHAASTDAASTDHVPGGPMPGMATPEQLAELNAASGVEAERIFLTLMIAHHKGALEMAESVLERSTNSVIVPFANSVIASQNSEIELMESMLAERQ